MVVGLPVTVMVPTYTVEVTSTSVVMVTKTTSSEAEAKLMFVIRKKRTAMMLRNCILMLVSAKRDMLIRRSDMYGGKFIDKARRSTDEGMKTQVLVMRSSNKKIV